MTTKGKLIIGLAAIFLGSATITAALVITRQTRTQAIKPEMANQKTTEVSYSKPPGIVLPAQTNVSEIGSPTVTAQPASTRPQIKGEVTIALLGDSMIDTLSPFDQLNKYLTQIYPNIKFKLLNYGVGATDINYAITRLNSSYRYNNQEIPALLLQKPDLVIVESFAYNHSSNDEAGFSRQNSGYFQIKSQLQNNGTKMIMLVTIAPNASFYASGAPGINFTADQRANEVLTINNYLKNAINFARDNNIALIDAYNPSLVSKNGGNLLYINSGDHIHPSPEGVEFICDIIAKTISKQNIIEQIISTKK